MISRLGILFLFILLAGCATTSSLQQTAITPSTQQKALSSLRNWNLQGLINIRTPNDSFSADWRWLQENKNYTISLFGPLGSHAIKLTGTPTSVLLETADGKKIQSDSAETLLKQELGWQLPVSNLYYWIRGLPAPGQGANTQYDNQSHLIRLNQQGWTIDYLRYTTIQGIDVPQKIFLENTNLKIKMIINQWQVVFSH